MKGLFILALMLCLHPLASSAQNTRELTSSDGKQKVSAQFVRYNAKNDEVTLRLANGRNLISPADKFSQSDRDYFAEQQKAKDLESALKVITDENSDREKKVRGQLTYKMKNIDMAFKVQNTSDSTFDNLNVEYWVIVEYDGKPRGEEYKTFHETSTISSISGRSEHIIKGPTVKLTLGADPGCATCPKVIAAAAAVGRDRIIGSKIVVRDASGKEIFSDASSNRMEVILSKGRY